MQACASLVHGLCGHPHPHCWAWSSIDKILPPVRWHSRPVDRKHAKVEDDRFDSGSARFDPETDLSCSTFVGTKRLVMGLRAWVVANPNMRRRLLGCESK